MTPDEYTNAEFYLPVGGGHKLKVWDWGNPRAKVTFVALHGGPGSGVDDGYKNYFDPRRHRVILFDQRGCGQSLPYGRLEHNTTPELVEDISKIADKLGVEKFWLYGYSWGSTLALAYVVAHPERVKGLVIGGIFAGSREDIEMMYTNCQRFYPDQWEKFLERVPTDWQDAPVQWCYDEYNSGDPERMKAATYAHYNVEKNIMFLDDRVSDPPYAEFDYVPHGLELHYISHECFMPQNHFIKHAAEIRCPVYVVQGRYDIVCAPVGAWNLCQALPDAKLYFTTANHYKEHETFSLIKSIICSII
jgi:proline iminopeptidase